MGISKMLSHLLINEILSHFGSQISLQAGLISLEFGWSKRQAQARQLSGLLWPEEETRLFQKQTLPTRTQQQGPGGCDSSPSERSTFLH